MPTSTSLVALTVAPAATIAAYRLEDLPASIAARITVHPVSGCWIVGGYHDKDGYARIGGQGAHRVIWETLEGLVPPKLVLDHREDQGCILNDGMPDKACGFPGHLRPVTNRENCTRNGVRGVAAINIRKDRCGRCERPLDLLNTYWYKNRRDCRACIRRRVREYKARQKAKADLIQLPLDLGRAA